MKKPHYILKETFELDDNQHKLVILSLLTFVFQAIVFYLLDPPNFNMKLALICFGTAFMYNIAYYKFFISSRL